MGSVSDDTLPLWPLLSLRFQKYLLLLFPAASGATFGAYMMHGKNKQKNRRPQQNQRMFESLLISLKASFAVFVFMIW
jgi:hypothetical protein